MPVTSREVRLVTVSREFGAGGSELAAALGRRLEWPVLDRNVVRLVAQRLQLDDGTVEHFDEHPPSLLARIAMVLVIPQPENHSFPGGENLPSHDAIADATRVVIEEAARSLPLIVVGHGAQCIFGGRADAFHVRLVAPAGARVSRVMRRMTIDAAAARALLRGADQDRQRYVQRYFHQDWRNELLYDLQINTGRLSIKESVETILGLVDAAAGPSTQAPEERR